jgi:hypothetical protein
MGSTLTVRHFPLPPSELLDWDLFCAGHTTHPSPPKHHTTTNAQHWGISRAHFICILAVCSAFSYWGCWSAGASSSFFLSSLSSILAATRHDHSVQSRDTWAHSLGLTTKTGRCKGCTDLHRLIRTLTLLISSLLPRQLRGAPLSPISLRRSGVPVCAPCYALLLCWLAVQTAWLNTFAAPCFREQGGHLNTGLLPSPSLHCTDQKCAD